VNVCRFADLVVVVKRPTSDGQSKISRVFNFADFAKIRCVRIISVLQYEILCNTISIKNYLQHFIVCLKHTVKAVSSWLKPLMLLKEPRFDLDLMAK